MPRTHRFSCTAFVVLVALLTSSAASADSNKARAQRLLAEGNALLDKGAYAQALESFREAYTAFPSPALLLNIGTALRGLERYAEANNNYNRWLAATRRPKHRSEVEAAIAELDRMVGRIEIDINELDVDVIIDGKEVDPRLYGNIVRVDPGVHQIVARKRGFRSAEATLAVGAGEKRTARLILQRPEVATKSLEGPDRDTGDDLGDDDLGDDDDDDDDEASSTGRAPRDPAVRVLKISGIATAGVGLLSLAVGLKFGLDARRLAGDVDQLAASGADAVQIAEAIDDGERANGRFIAFTAIGGAALVAGGVLYAIGHLRGKTAERERDSGRSVAITPAFGPDTLGLAISGDF
jgi:tetratricopeptide (TPR) repeat protein